MAKRTTTETTTINGRKAEVKTEFYADNEFGMRVVTTRWIQSAAKADGGHRTGTITRTTVRGNAADGTLYVITPKHRVKDF